MEYYKITRKEDGHYGIFKGPFDLGTDPYYLLVETNDEPNGEHPSFVTRLSHKNLVSAIGAEVINGNPYYTVTRLTSKEIFLLEL